MKRRKLLIATQNPAKVKEIMNAFATLPFDLVSLTEFPDVPTAEEPYNTIEFNAIAKAQHYATHTGLLALADDSGIFVDELQGWPGAQSARIGENDDNRMEKVLEKLQGVAPEKRGASFRCVLAVVDPNTHSIHTSYGQEQGTLLETPVQERRAGFGYDPIFFLPDLGKTYAEIPVEEKNKISHRAKALHEMEFILKKEFGPRHIVVPCGFLIQNGKMYLQKRNDPFRPDFHAKWEFPGGGVEFGEQMISNVIREVKEETGYTVEVVQQLSHIQVEAHEDKNFSYQVYLVPYVCKIVGGKFEARDHEVMEGKWFDLQEVPELPLVGNDKEFFAQVVSELEQVSKEHKL